MTAVGGDRGGTAGALDVIHERLQDHFNRLRVDRDRHGSGKPIFALEHGLTDPEWALLQAEVRIAAAAGRLPTRSWLPFIVYAAEVGYEYSGDEYWQTFESRTPGWAQHGDRHYIRRKFRDFNRTFGGAEPTGPWARHFSIICWPITHAVLPTDLQRQLARLLFEYRHGLTSELLAHPDELGKRLAARAWHTSERFKVFAQNTDLLGQVSTALLGEEEDSPYLLPSTLRRIATDLSAERQARLWLNDAKSIANRVRTHGFTRHGGSPRPDGQSAKGSRLPAATDPKLFLRREPEGWVGMIELPDLSPLAERLPSLHSELGRLRCRVAGVAGAPLPTGQLLYPGKRLRFATWPDPRSPLLEFEGGSQALASLLLDQCVISAGPIWLFRAIESNLAIEVRGKFVRPGHEYVLLSPNAFECDLPDWITLDHSVTSGVVGYSLRVPSPLEEGHLAPLRDFGLGSVADVEIRPAGLVPANWDGEGSAEWTAGEDPIVALRSTRATAQCIVTVDGAPKLVPWGDGEDEIFLGITGLGVGTHLVEVALLSPTTDERTAEGSLTIVMRAPHQRPTSGSLREALAVLPHPANPSLAELWDGLAALEMIGPPDVPVKVRIALVGRTDSEVLVTRTLSLRLPVDTQAWARAFAAQFQGTAEAQNHYDEAEACIVTVTHAELGTVDVRCEREFAALRWAAGNDHDGPFVRLIDNTDELNVAIERFDFARPDAAIAMSPNDSQRVRNADGGLIRARSGDLAADIILPPRIRNLSDLKRMSFAPRVQSGPLSAHGVIKLIELAGRWAKARSAADPFGSRLHRAVLTAITRELVCLVSGARWTRLERALAGDEASVTVKELVEVVGEQEYQQALAAEISQRLYLRNMTPENRAIEFAGLLSRHARTAGVTGEDIGLAELLLRMASEPAGALRCSNGDLASAVNLVLASPVLLRAARLLVLEIHLNEEADAGTCYRGWAWQ